MLIWKDDSFGLGVISTITLDNMIHSVCSKWKDLTPNTVNLSYFRDEKHNDISTDSNL